MYFVSKPIITNGLVMYLDAGNKVSYTSGSSVWNDLSGNNNGILTNNPSFSDDNGGCIVFDGSNDRIVLPDTLKQTGSQSISIWFNPSTWNPGGVFEPGIFGGFAFGSSGTPGGISIAEYNNSLYVTAYNGSQKLEANASLPPLNSWTSITVTYDNTTGTLKTYLNSVLRRTSVFGAGASNIVWDVPITLGAAYLNGDYLDFQGKIAVSQIYNKTLTQSEIIENFNTLKGRYGL